MKNELDFSNIVTYSHFLHFINIFLRVLVAMIISNAWIQFVILWRKSLSICRALENKYSLKNQESYISTG